jgi:hypothetical protein
MKVESRTGDIATQMARPRKNETSVNIAPAASSAAPVRRKTASTPRTRATPKTAGTLSEPAPQEPVAASVVTVVSEAAIVEHMPSHEEVASLAYNYWVERGFAHGSPEQDWLRAEAELRHRGLATA